MFKFVRRFGPTVEINDLPPKPKAMHWRTYKRLVDRYDVYDDQWGLEAIRRFGLRL